MGEPLAARARAESPLAAARPLGDRLEADRRDAGEEAGAAACDREVGDVADVAVEDGLRGGLAAPPPARRLAPASASARIIPKAERSTPTGSRPARAERLERSEATMSRRAAIDDDVDLRGRALLGGDAADHLVLEHRLVERHRHLLLGLEADRRVHLLRVLDRRQAHGADDDPLVADAEPDLLGELVRGEESLSAAASAVGVGDLALVEDAGRQRRDRRSPISLGEPLSADLGRGDAAGLDLEPDQRLVLFLRQLDHPAQLSAARRPAVLDRPIWTGFRLVPCPYLELGKARQPSSPRLPADHPGRTAPGR